MKKEVERVSQYPVGTFDNKENVFNINKTPEQYAAKSPLMFGQQPGLFDTVNKHYPKIWDFYKEMKSLDWDEKEFDYTQCNSDFKNCQKSEYDMMIRTLAWQWEADSMACRSVAPLLAPFITDSSMWAAEQRISDNEVIHAATYSEIVRMSFDNPDDVIREILAIKESFVRMNAVKKVFDELYVVSHQYALRMITADQAYDTVLLGIIALYMLERIQFMGSFAITFTICGDKWFQPIAKAVQRIAQDELEVHVEYRKCVISELLSTQQGQEAFKRLKSRILELFHEITNSELSFTDNNFSEGRELVGATSHTVKQWILFCAGSVDNFLYLESDRKFPKHNPMVFLETWLDITKTQGAPQEGDGNQYKIGVISRDDENHEFEVDF